MFFHTFLHTTRLTALLKIRSCEPPVFALDLQFPLALTHPERLRRGQRAEPGLVARLIHQGGLEPPLEPFRIVRDPRQRVRGGQQQQENPLLLGGPLP